MSDPKDEWPEKYRGQLFFHAGKYYGIKEFQIASGEGILRTVVVTDPDKEKQGELIENG